MMNPRTNERTSRLSHVPLYDQRAFDLNNLKRPHTLGSGLHRVLGSTFFWLLAGLLLVDVILITVKPLRYLVECKYIPLDQNPIVSKIPEFLGSDKRPDALFLGSSLPMNALAKWDAQYAKALNATDYAQIRVYTGARYFEDQLALSRVKMRIFNLTCVGCMASDAYLLLKRAIDVGKKPKFVFWGIAPRDFVDTQVPPLGKTPVYEVLSDWRCLHDLLREKATFDEWRDLVVSTLWHFYKVKADYRTLFVSAVCDLIGRPASLYEATAGQANRSPDAMPASGHSAAPDEGRTAGSTGGTAKPFVGPVIPADRKLDEYWHRYNPPNFVRLAQEAEYLKKLIVLCARENIKLVVIHMPITDANLDLLDGRLLSQYKEKVLRTARGGAALFVDLNENGHFQTGDFQDCVHTNAAGGKKVQDILLRQLAESGILQAF